MLTKRENLIETIRGGTPDRFVNQFEAFEFIFGSPYSERYPRPKIGETVKDGWGVTISYPPNVPGAFPVHDDEHMVLTDVTRWREVIKAPRLDFTDEQWEKYIPRAEAIDRKEKFAAVMVAPGVFALLTNLMGMEGAMISMLTEPEATQELVDYITEWEIEYARLLCKYFRPDMILHHDDWGSQKSTFMSPDMFHELFMPAYKKIYSCYRENGVELVVHHNDSYSATLVPDMIEMGIDIWQGCMTTNNVPELVKKYGSQISFMGDLDNGVIDVEDWSRELVRREVERALKNNRGPYYIPSLVMGLPNSIYPGVYEAVSEEIERLGAEIF